jgi:hypothetical protein
MRRISPYVRIPQGMKRGMTVLGMEIGACLVLYQNHKVNWEAFLSLPFSGRDYANVITGCELDSMTLWFN